MNYDPTCKKTCTKLKEEGIEFVVIDDTSNTPKSYGGYSTFSEARKAALANIKYFPYGRGWFIPSIYKILDTRITFNAYGAVRIPIPTAWPVTASYSNDEYLHAIAVKEGSE